MKIKAISNQLLTHKVLFHHITAVGVSRLYQARSVVIFQNDTERPEEEWIEVVRWILANSSAHFDPSTVPRIARRTDFRWMSFRDIHFESESDALMTYLRYK